MTPLVIRNRSVRHLHSLIILLSLGMLLAAQQAAHAELTVTAKQTSAAARPNIIVILCDDLGYGDLECYGHPVIKTPNLNALAESGIRLTDCYSAAPVCSPSRVGLLTGRSPNRAGVYDWIPEAKSARPDARDQVHLRESEFTLAKLLKSAGYATCMSGKWHCNAKFNNAEQPQPDAAGFDHWFGTQNNAAPSHADPKNYVRNGKPAGQLEGFSCQIAASEAIRWITEHRTNSPDQPFFTYLAFHEPHEPVASPAPLVEKYLPNAANEDEAHFFANVENVDLAVGRVRKTLDELEIADDTLIFFTSDNGPETLKRYRGAGRSYGRPTPLRGMKLWTTDAGFRVAGILHWPNGIASEVAKTESQVVSSLDLMPTFAALSGAKLPANVALDGTDISSLFSGQQIARSKPLLWCYFNAINEERVAMRNGKWKMLAKLSGGKLEKLVNVHDGNRDRILEAKLTDFELYDISADITESKNLMDSVNNAAEMREQMVQQFRELVTTSHFWRRPVQNAK